MNNTLVARIASILEKGDLPIFNYAVLTFVGFFLSWWWLIIPILLFKPVRKFYLLYKNEKWAESQKKELIEIKIPRDSVKPISAMESVIDSIWQSVYLGDPSWKEKWIDGQELLPVSYEICSFGGEIHFYIRIPKAYRDSIEAAIFSQYPDVEISTVEDYTKKVPQDIPNKEWNMWCADFGTPNDFAYPIKTYEYFETGSESVEEKRVDPMAALLEAMGKIVPGEQIWIQIVAKPISMTMVKPFLKKGDEIITKLLNRPGDPKPRKLGKKLFELVVKGKSLEEEKKEEEPNLIPSEMKLSPGEREKVAAVEKKMEGLLNKCHIRFIFLGKRDVFFKPRLKLPFGYFANFSSYNILVPRGGTMPKANQKWYNFFLLKKRRVYRIARQSFRRYQARLRWYYPLPEKKLMLLNNRELATLYHFPSARVAPAPFVSRIDAKTGGSPVELPR